MFVTLTLGRGHQADIKLEDDSVSRVHAEITRTDQGRYYLIDRNSTRGTYVRQNNAWQQHTQGYVSQQDVLKMGDMEVAMAQVAGHFESYFMSQSEQIKREQPPGHVVGHVDLEPLSIRPRRNQSTGQIELD